MSMTNEQTMALCAIRYCLGRRSYIVGQAVEWALRYGQSPDLRRILMHDIRRAIESNDVGDPTDEREWRMVLTTLEALEP